MLNRKTPYLELIRNAAFEKFEKKICLSDKVSSHIMIYSDRNKTTRRGHQSSIYRGSVYKGVSQNGSKWQVFYTLNNKKMYTGIAPTEDGAARLFDKLEILHVGSKAKTNFFYTKVELEEMIKAFKTIIFK